MLLAVARHPRCYSSGGILSRVRLQGLSHRKFSERIAADNGFVNDPIKSLSAMNSIDAATVIVSRLSEKELLLVKASFECAQNRPNRLVKLTTRHKVDVAWMNTWFKSLHVSDTIPYYPFPITPTNHWQEARVAIIEAICGAVKYQNNNDFPSEAEQIEAKKKMDDEISDFVDENFSRIPISTTTLIADNISKCNGELISAIVLKKMLRKSAGIHAHILPGLFKRLAFPFNTVRISILFFTMKLFISLRSSLINGNLYISALKKSVISIQVDSLSRK